jgi:hypothetical protein
MMTTVARVVAIITLAALAACSAAQSSLPQTRSGASAQARVAASWIAPAAKSGALLYVTGGADVDVFQWPTLRTAGVLTGFQQTTGACVDAAGDVWIADAYAQKLYEYAHGGTTPIATLDDAASFPNGCAVDKRNGNLVAGNEYNNNVGHGSITLYRRAAGEGTIYYDSSLDDVFSLDYAPNGNLYLDGWTGYSFGMQKFVRKQFENFTIKGTTIGYPGGVQYWKNQLTVADAGTVYTTATIYRINKYGKVLGQTSMGQAHQSYQYQIINGKVICACFEDRNVQIYPYPSGGTPTRTFTKLKGVQPWAAVVSPATAPKSQLPSR